MVFPKVVTVGVANGAPGLMMALPAPPAEGSPPVQLAAVDQLPLKLPFQNTSADADEVIVATKIAAVIAFNTAWYETFIFMMVLGLFLLRLIA